MQRQGDDHEQPPSKRLKTSGAKISEEEERKKLNSFLNKYHDFLKRRFPENINLGCSLDTIFQEMYQTETYKKVIDRCKKFNLEYQIICNKNNDPELIIKNVITKEETKEVIWEGKKALLNKLDHTYNFLQKTFLENRNKGISINESFSEFLNSNAYKQTIDRCKQFNLEFQIILNENNEPEMITKDLKTNEVVVKKVIWQNSAKTEAKSNSDLPQNETNDLAKDTYEYFKENDSLDPWDQENMSGSSKSPPPSSLAFSITNTQDWKNQSQASNEDEFDLNASPSNNKSPSNNN